MSVIGGKTRRFEQKGKVIAMYFVEARPAGEINGRKYPAKDATWRADCVVGYQFDSKDGFSNATVASFDISEQQHEQLKFGSNVNCVFDVIMTDKGTYDKAISLSVV